MRLLAAALSTLCGLGLGACQDDRHVIGRFVDEGCDGEGGALVCSGFEKPDLSEFDDVIDVNAGHAEQTDQRAYHGEGALHAASSGAESVAVVAREFPAVNDGELYFRARLYVPEGPTETINVFFLGDYATPDPFKGVDFNLENGFPSIYVPESNPDRFTSTSLVIPRDRWFCFLVDLTVSADAGRVRLYVDGDLALDRAGLDTRPDAGIHLLRAGVDWSSKQTAPFDVYMDDLLLTTDAVTCDE